MNKISNSKYRLKRFSYFVELTKSIPENGPLRILDIGGEENYWEDKIHLLQRPALITLLNTRNPPSTKNFVTSLIGDARSVPEIPDRSFDIVHSNSVIEHVGRWNDMRAMAAEVRRLAPAYFIQTPYFWFPVEPHYHAAFFHWLPDSIRAKILMRTKLGPVPRMSSLDDAIIALQTSVLLDRSMMASLFPDANIVFEKVFGLPKSLLAIKAPR